MKKTVSINQTKQGELTVTYRFTAARASQALGAEDFEPLEIKFEREGLKLPKVNGVYMVGSSEYVGPDRSRDYQPGFAFAADNGAGWCGNSNPEIRCYRGWRGTTDDWAFYGLGVRKCYAVNVRGRRSKVVIIKFGRDLKADQD